MPMMPLRAALVVALLMLTTACAARSSNGEPPQELLTSLQATMAGDSAAFLLQVTNAGAEPVVLAFDSEPRALFVVEREGVRLWSSHEEADVSGGAAADTLQPGGTRSYQASWRVPMGLRGALTVTGMVRDARSPLLQSTRFQLP